MALQCHQIHFLWRSFRSSNLCFWQKKAVEYEIWTLFARWKEIDQFLEGLFGKQHSVLSQSLHGSSVSQNKTPVKVFWFKQFSFHTKSRNKIWNLGTFLLLERNWSNFFFRGWGWGGGGLVNWFEKQDSVFFHTFHGPSVSQKKTPVKVFWFK